MRYFLLIFVVVVLFFAVSGCQSGGCISVGGGYKDFNGNIEYCFDSEKSKQSGTPTFNETTEAEDGEKEETELFGFNLDEVNEILDIVNGLGIRSATKQHPVQELKSKLKNN